MPSSVTTALLVTAAIVTALSPLVAVVIAGLAVLFEIFLVIVADS